MKRATNLSMPANGLTLIELLVVIAVVSILAGIAAPSYLGWRVSSRNWEAVRFVEQQVSTTRTNAKRSGIEASIVFTDGSGALVINGTPVTIPHNSVIELEDGELTLTLGFDPLVGRQFVPPDDPSTGDPDFSRRVPLTVRTGTLGVNRATDVFILPPLAKVGAQR